MYTRIEYLDMNSNQNNCKYTDYFIDAENNERRDYSCPRHPLTSGYCKLHDDSFHISNEDEVRSLFDNEVNLSLNSSTELLCFGFHLPSIDLHNLQFKKPVYFV